MADGWEAGRLVATACCPPEEEVQADVQANQLGLPLAGALPKVTKDPVNGTTQLPELVQALLSSYQPDDPSHHRITLCPDVERPVEALHTILKYVDCMHVPQPFPEDLAKAVSYVTDPVPPSTGSKLSRGEEIRRWFTVVTTNEQTSKSDWARLIARLQEPLLVERTTLNMIMQLRQAVEEKAWKSVVVALYTLEQRGIRAGGGSGGPGGSAISAHTDVEAAAAALQTVRNDFEGRSAAAIAASNVAALSTCLKESDGVCTKEHQTAWQVIGHLLQTTMDAKTLATPYQISSDTANTINAVLLRQKDIRIDATRELCTTNLAAGLIGALTEKTFREQADALELIIGNFLDFAKSTCKLASSPPEIRSVGDLVLLKQEIQKHAEWLGQMQVLKESFSATHGFPATGGVVAEGLLVQELFRLFMEFSSGDNSAARAKATLEDVHRRKAESPPFPSDSPHLRSVTDMLTCLQSRVMELSNIVSVALENPSVFEAADMLSEFHVMLSSHAAFVEVVAQFHTTRLLPHLRASLGGDGDGGYWWKKWDGLGKGIDGAKAGGGGPGIELHYDTTVTEPTWLTDFWLDCQDRLD